MQSITSIKLVEKIIIFTEKSYFLWVILFLAFSKNFMGSKISLHLGSNVNSKILRLGFFCLKPSIILVFEVFDIITHRPLKIVNSCGMKFESLGNNKKFECNFCKSFEYIVNPVSISIILRNKFFFCTAQ